MVACGVTHVFYAGDCAGSKNFLKKFLGDFLEKNRSEQNVSKYSYIRSCIRFVRRRDGIASITKNFLSSEFTPPPPPP